MRHCTLILNAWNDKHWIEPELLEQPELLQVKLTLHIQNEPINEPIIEPIIEPINEHLSNRQIAIIMAIKEQSFFTRDDLAKEVGVSLATLKREISILRKNGYIGRGGSNKNGQWLLLKKICK